MSEPKKKKTVKKIVSDVVFSVVMAFLGLVVLFAVLDKTTGFSINGNHLIWVLSPSMETTIPRQSYILVEDCKASDVKENDIVMFISEDPAISGQYNTHRVIEIKPDGSFVTKGDNNLTDDGIYSAKPENIVAKYKRNMPFLSFFGRLYATPAGITVTLGLIIILFSAWFAIDIKDRKKQNKKELMEQMVQEEIKRLEQEAEQKERK